MKRKKQIVIALILFWIGLIGLTINPDETLVDRLVGAGAGTMMVIAIATLAKMAWRR